MAAQGCSHMDDRKFFEFFQTLRVGRYQAESEPVGDLDIKVVIPQRLVGFSVWIDRNELAASAVASGETPEQTALGLTTNDRDEIFRKMLDRLKDFLPTLPEALRQWLTYAV